MRAAPNLTFLSASSYGLTNDLGTLLTRFFTYCYSNITTSPTIPENADISKLLRKL